MNYGNIKRIQEVKDQLEIFIFENCKEKKIRSSLANVRVVFMLPNTKGKEELFDGTLENLILKLNERIKDADTKINLLEKKTIDLLATQKRDYDEKINKTASVIDAIVQKMNEEGRII